MLVFVRGTRPTLGRGMLGTIRRQGMNRKFAWSLVAITAASGCGGDGGESTIFPERDFECAAGAATPCATDTPSSTDAERTATEPAGEEATYTFVVSTISLPEAASGAAAGFNL